MTEYVVTLAEAATHFGKLQGEFRKAAHRGLVSAAMRGVQIIVTQIIPGITPYPPVDRGLFRAGWRAVPTRDGAEIVNDEPHAVFIEEGVRAENVKPGLRMGRAIYEWVIRKGIETEPYEAIRVTYAIMAAMKRRGIFKRGKGLGILKMLTSDNGIWRRYFDKVIEREVEREIGRVV